MAIDLRTVLPGPFKMEKQSLHAQRRMPCLEGRERILEEKINGEMNADADNMSCQSPLIFDV